MLGLKPGDLGFKGREAVVRWHSVPFLVAPESGLGVPRPPSFADSLFRSIAFGMKWRQSVLSRRPCIAILGYLWLVPVALVEKDMRSV